MKKIIISLIITIMLAGCSTTPPTKAVSATEATQLAVDYLSAQPLQKDHYLLELPHFDSEDDQFYRIKFERTEPSNPSFGIVKIDKKTRQATWEPQAPTN
ncbi:hypothetical protein COV81_01355 [Candidatus Peregrinibacteria bacterium CG11_big_fil_rev_8_21_14_0_20_41_10]|nr:MAG: hypothetical protein COV81_01355 [Candidatus Peregrinibacteria bacterium CG11_big_fil_rev_8_21_14_0_20_41_10]PIZ74617.1 MAG: hypothetical protein COY06_03850 [Candidatus Peregrinibacteria bacterium CG_4_10_14_0_2_um_filter_41_8]